MRYIWKLYTFELTCISYNGIVREAFISRNMNFSIRLLCDYIFTITFLGRIFSDLRISVAGGVVWDNSIKVMPDTAQGERESLPNFQMRTLRLAKCNI